MTQIDDIILTEKQAAMLNKLKSLLSNFTEAIHKSGEQLKAFSQYYDDNDIDFVEFLDPHTVGLITLIEESYDEYVNLMWRQWERFDKNEM